MVKGSLVGTGLVAHNNFQDVRGSTYIYVHNLQNESSAAAISNAPTGYIIGGGVFQVNASGRSTITGSTNVTIDTGDLTGTFAKTIVGGSYRTGGGAYVINGDTIVTITARNGVTFENDIYAGSYSNNGNATIGGNSILTIDGGTYQGKLVASGGGSGVVVSANAYMYVKQAVFEDTATLKATEGTVDTSYLTLGEAGKTIQFSTAEAGTTIAGFDVLSLVSDATFEGNVTLDGIGSIVLDSAATLGGNLALATEGSLNLDLSGIGELNEGDIIFTADGFSNITSVQVTFADGVGGKIELSEDGKSLVYVAVDLLEWNAGESGIWTAENVWKKGDAAASFSDGVMVAFHDQEGVDKSIVTLDGDVIPLSIQVNITDTL